MDLLEDELGKSPRTTLKFKLDVKIPDTQVDDEISNKSSRPQKNADKVNFNVLILNEKSQEDKKRKKSNSNTITVDHSSIDSVSANSTNLSSKLHSFRSKTRRVNNKALGRERRTKASMKIGKERTSDKSSDKSSSISERQTSLDNSLAAKRARMSKKSNSLSEYSDLKSKEHLLKMQVTAGRKTAETVNFDQKSWYSNRTISLSDNSIIEESIDTIIDDNDIVSGLSRVDKNVVVKTENFMNVSQNSGHSEAEDVSVTIVEYSENSYANDTFEEISNSTAPSKSKFQDEKVTREKNYNSNNEKVDIKLDLSPKSYATETDLESASYVSDLGKIGADVDNMTQLLKSSNFTDLHLEEQSKHSQQPTDSERNSPGNKFNKMTRTNS
jgi:hypothetical protein